MAINATQTRRIGSLCATTALLLFLVTGAPTAAPAAQQEDRVAVGDTAIDFTLQSIDGETFHLADLRGEKNAIIIFFRGSW